MTKTYKIIAISLISIIALVGAFQFFLGHPDTAVAAFRTSGVQESGTYHLFSAITATSSSATSSEISIAGASKISVFMNRPTSTSSATSTFSVLVTLDGSNYIAYNKLIDNVTNTNAQTLTRVASKVLVGTTSAMLSFDLTSDTFLGMKCVAVIAATGTQACSVLVEY